jgi:hypothetical protein
MAMQQMQKWKGENDAKYERRFGCPNRETSIYAT